MQNAEKMVLKKFKTRPLIYLAYVHMQNVLLSE